MSSRRLVALLLVLAGAIPVADAQPAASDAPTLAAAAPTPPAARSITYSFRQLGSQDVAQLRGVDGSLYLPLGIRLDETVTRARLTLRYAHSPALLPELSHLRLSLNNETIGTAPLPRDKAGVESTLSLDIDPRYFSDYNQLRVQLIGHYTLECEDPLHSSLWATISPDSQLELELQPLKLASDLGLLPAPFFDRRDSRRLDLPFVFAAKPDFETLRSAGVLASWFGAQAAYRSARFPTLYERLPERHAVVFATNAALPKNLDLQPVQQATLAVVDHPGHAGSKLLLIQGRDGAQLAEAVEALVLGQVVLTGARAQITQLVRAPERPAYDAPLWIRTDRPVKLGELVEDPSQLQSRGLNAPPLRINIRVPPDLLTWQRAGVPIDLRYRYTSPVERDNSLLSISINEEFIQAFRLQPQDEQGAAGRLLVPLLDQAPGNLSDSFTIPAFQVGADNQLQFQFALDYHKSGLCQGSSSDLARAALDPESTIDLSGFPHYTALPNLALFANAGFPFSKYADLAQTIAVLPDQPSARNVEDLLFLLGRIGRQTGAAATRLRLTPATQLAADTDADLLIIDGRSGRDLLGEWQAQLPVQLDHTQRRYSPRPRAAWFVPDLLRSDPTQENTEVTLQAQGAVAALIGLESPLKSGRSVVVVTATEPRATQLALDVLEDGGLVRQIRGDTVLIRGREVSSHRGAEPYYVGELPWWLAIWFFLSRHPLLLVLFALIGGVIVAFFVYRFLQQRAARRLAH